MANATLPITPVPSSEAEATARATTIITRTETEATPKPTQSLTPPLSPTPITVATKNTQPGTGTTTPRSPSPTPKIPYGEIQIYNLDNFSRVVSPIPLSAYLRPGAKGLVTIELLGEDQRVLTRQTKVFHFANPGAMVTLKMDVEFEISATAEAGRLRLSVADEHGRITAVNSVELILLSMGEADITPPTDTLAPILIQKPTPKKLIQGGTVLVSGMARAGKEQQLLVQLITQEGSIVSQCACLAPITPGNGDGTYGTFAIEVPYKVTKFTHVLLVVWIPGSTNSDIAHLSSVDIMLSP